MKVSVTPNIEEVNITSDYDDSKMVWAELCFLPNAIRKRRCLYDLYKADISS